MRRWFAPHPLPYSPHPGNKKLTLRTQVGRTASQCLDRYQKLLDEAEARESSTAGDLALTGPDGVSAPSADDVRKFRPGETDPDPETKPARPDAVDMDEDEKEMLSEARARLANTQGKKAKRKARERQLEESRRLAVLQKRRELKHAGINIKLVNRKKGEMDYNADIPFEKKPSLGFYDTGEEQIRNEKQRAAFDPRKAQSNSKRKGDQEQENDNDRKKRKNDKNGAAAAFASAAAAGKMQKIREAEQLSKRRSLVLPAPQVSETELEQIVKVGVMGEAAQQMARQSENDATRGLVFDYTPINTSAPIRTPRAPPEQDHIANEIRNIRALTETQSSLLGGENTPLHTTGTTGFDGIAPRKTTIATPNPLATPFRSGVGAGPGATPAGPGATPLRTPRDTLAINNMSGSLNTGMTPRDQKLREQSLKHQLRAGFASLPKPAEIDFDLPDEEDAARAGGGGEGDAAALEEDAAIRDERERKHREAEEEAERKRRTQVIQRGLPRPSIVDIEKLISTVEISPSGSPEEEIKSLITREASLLLAHDAHRFPVKGGKILPAAAGKSRALPPPAQLPDDLLSRAKDELLTATSPSTSSAFSSAFTSLPLPGLEIYSDPPPDSAAHLEAIHTHLIHTALTANKLEKKLTLHFGGYLAREKLLATRIQDASEACAATRRELDVFRLLQVHEQGGLVRRLEGLRGEAEYVERREGEAQGVFRRRREELGGLVGAGGR